MAAAVLEAEKLGPVPESGELTERELQKNNLPDVLRRWNLRNGSEQDRAFAEQSFCVPKEAIVMQGYDLSMNRYKKVLHEDIEHRAPAELMDKLERIEAEIQQGVSELKRMLK